METCVLDMVTTIMRDAATVEDVVLELAKLTEVLLLPVLMLSFCKEFSLRCFPTRLIAQCVEVVVIAKSLSFCIQKVLGIFLNIFLCIFVILLLKRTDNFLFPSFSLSHPYYGVCFLCERKKIYMSKEFFFGVTDVTL